MIIMILSKLHFIGIADMQMSTPAATSNQENETNLQETNFSLVRSILSSY